MQTPTIKLDSSRRKKMEPMVSDEWGGILDVRGTAYERQQLPCSSFTCLLSLYSPYYILMKG